MKTTKALKILGVVVFLLVFSMIYSKDVEASEASVSANNCNVGENFTVTVNIPQDVSAYDIGGVTVTYSDGSKQSASRKVGVNMDLSWPGNYTASFPGKVAGNATISVSNVILSNSSNAVVNTITTLETTITITDNSPAQSSTASSTPSESESASTPAPSAPVKLNFKDGNEKMYTSRRVNVRQNYGTDSNIIQTLAVGTEVTRTGVSDGNKDGYAWSRISYNGITGYVITGALTYDAPASTAPEENTEEKPEEEKTEEEQPEENQETQELSETDEEKISAFSEKFGSIPEVGVNIMPFMFIGSCVACLTIMIEVKKLSK